MVSLDGLGGTLERNRFNNVRVKSALEKELNFVTTSRLNFGGLNLENFNKGIANKFSLLFRVSNTLELVKELLTGINNSQVNSKTGV